MQTLRNEIKNDDKYELRSERNIEGQFKGRSKTENKRLCTFPDKLLYKVRIGEGFELWLLPPRNKVLLLWSFNNCMAALWEEKSNSY